PFFGALSLLVFVVRRRICGAAPCRRAGQERAGVWRGHRRRSRMPPVADRSTSCEGTPMRWPALLIGTAALLVTVQTRASTAEDVERAVQAIQAAFNKGDVDALKGLMTEDHVSIMTYAQIYGAASLLKSLGDFKFSEYKISGLKVKVVAKDVALASHEATIKG